MPFDGSGNFDLTQDFSADRDAGPPASQISADKVMNVLQDIANGLEACQTRSGQNRPSANIDWNGYKIVDLGAAGAPADVPQSRQIAEGTITYWGLTAGTASAITAANSFVTAVAVGAVVRVTASATNAINATFAAGGATGNIVEKDGNNIKAGRCLIGKPFSVQWDGTYWVLIDAGVKAFGVDNASLLALSALTPAADQLPYFNGASGAALTGLSAFMRTVLDDADQATAQATLGMFPPGTVMPFAQTSAPTGWTKSTTHNDKIPRFVSGAASSGGSTAFSTVFAARTIARANLPNITLAGASDNPGNHTHLEFVGGTAGSSNPVAAGTSPASRLNQGGGAQTDYDMSAIAGTPNAGLTSPNGGHTHATITESLNGGVTQTTIDFAVAYVDLILAVKN